MLIRKYYIKFAYDYDHFVCNDCGFWGLGTPIKCPNCGSSFVSHY